MRPSGLLSRVAWLWLGLAFLGIPACRWTDIPLWVAAKPAPNAWDVEEVRGIVYYDGPGADQCRHRLDLFLPKGCKDFPVVVFIHGGAWCTCDNHFWGLYPSVGQFLASQGIGVVMPNYRLSPGVKHPDHIRDVARAFAWTHKHIAEHGGCPGNLFVAGHSAGGHLAALLATDERWLQGEGLNLADIKGAIAVSGVYHVTQGPVNATLGGDTPLALRLDELFPMRGCTSWRGPLAHLAGIPIHVDLYGRIFGGDAERAAASPLTYVRPGLPPFLLFGADNDLPTLPAGSEEFYQALRAQQCDVQLVWVKDRNHDSIMFHAIEPADPVAAGMVDFIRQHTGPIER
jgi:acetyl esterase/lipase